MSFNDDDNTNKKNSNYRKRSLEVAPTILSRGTQNSTIRKHLSLLRTTGRIGTARTPVFRLFMRRCFEVFRPAWATCCTDGAKFGAEESTFAKFIGCLSNLKIVDVTLAFPF